MTAINETFHVDMDLRADQYYAAFGYVVLRNLIPHDAIDSIVESYQKTIKPYDKPLPRRNGALEKHRLSEHGSVLNTLLVTHQSDDPVLQDFAARVRSVICHDVMADALGAVTPHTKHIAMQSLLFEQGVSGPHQDDVYMDTRPNGHLNAAWIALEDIADDATQVYILPGSQNYSHSFPSEAVYQTGEYERGMKDYLAPLQDQLVHPDLKRGDVMFWNSRTIHGSTEGSNPARTRLSMTVHFIPDGFGFGSLYRSKNKRLQNVAKYSDRLSYYVEGAEVPDRPKNMIERLLSRAIHRES